MQQFDHLNSAEDKPTWKKIIFFLLIVGICLILGNIILLAMAVMGGLPLSSDVDIFGAVADPKMRPYIKTGIGLNHLIMFTGSALIFAYWLKRKDWKSYFEWKSMNPRLLLSLILLLICAYPLIIASTKALEGVEWITEMDENNLEALMKMLQMDNFIDLIVNLCIVAALPAIGEELLFRGVVQKELVAKIKSPHVAILITSIIFSAVHLQIQGFLPKLVIGLVLGYAYYWTKSLWYPMILHFINNALPTIALFIVGDEIESIEEEAIQSEFLVLAISVVISCFLCYFVIRNIRSQIDQKDSLNV